MTHLRVPRVTYRPGGLPDWARPVPDQAELEPVLGSLLEAQQAARRHRGDARSLVPGEVARREAQFAAERAVEENLARGRVLIRAEIKRARDPNRFGSDRVRFPRVGAGERSLAMMVFWTTLAVFAPFIAVFALVAVL